MVRRLKLQLEVDLPNCLFTPSLDHKNAPQNPLEPETHSLSKRTYCVNIYKDPHLWGVFQPFDFPSSKACAAASAGNDTVTFIR